MTTLISAEDTWALWTILSLSVAISIYLEQKYVWANKITGCILAIIFTLVREECWPSIFLAVQEPSWEAL